LHTNKLKELFHLTQHETLFTTAVTPKSCGGTEEFKYLALIGDKILDLCLIELLSKAKVVDTGALTRNMKQIHNWKTLSQLAYFLGLDQLMKPIDPKHVLTGEEVKEAIEALLATSYQVHGIPAVIEIVTDLLAIIDQEKYQEIDYISQLYEFFQEQRLSPPELSDYQNTGSDHDPHWSITLKVNYLGESLQVNSDTFAKKQEAKNQAAQMLLQQLQQIPPDLFGLSSYHL